MRLRDRILRLFAPRPSFFTDEKGRPRTVVKTDSADISFSLSSTERTQQYLENLWKYYTGESTIFAAINYTAWNTVMSGYDVVCKSQEVKDIIEEFRLETDLDTKLLDSVIYCLVFGDGFMERIFNKQETKLLDVKVVNPMTMKIEYDKYGQITGYRQVINGKEGELIDPKYIAHFRFFPDPKTPYGISIITPSIDTLKRKVRTDKAIANAIIRHGTPKYIVSIGSDKIQEPIPDTVFEEIKRELKNITEKNEIIVPWTVKVDSIDEKGISGVEEYFNYFQSQLVVGLLCPEEALGLGRGSTEATAYVKAIMYERMIKSFQLKLASFMVREIFKPLLQGYGYSSEDLKDLRVVFRSVTDEDEAMKAKWLGNLLRGYKNEPKPFTINEIRAMFGLPPLSDEELEKMKAEYKMLAKSEDDEDD